MAPILDNAAERDVLTDDGAGPAKGFDLVEAAGRHSLHSRQRSPSNRPIRQVASPAVADIAGVPVPAIAPDALIWSVSDWPIGQVALPAVADVARVPVPAVDLDAGVRGRRWWRRNARHWDGDDGGGERECSRKADDHDDLQVFRKPERRAGVGAAQWGRRSLVEVRVSG
jgi:hypothetical protein